MRNRFRHKLFLFLGVIILIVGLVVGSLVYTKKQDETKAAEARKMDTAYSIQQGLLWLEKSNDQINAFQWLALDYLQRQYQLDPKFSASGIELKAEAGQFGLELETYKRIIDPNKLVTSLPLENASPMSQMMMMAANCDRIPLPTDYPALLQKNIDMGGYNLTHAAFSLDRIKENGCQIDTEQDRAMRQVLADKMVELVINPETTADLRYEAIAFLQAMGRRDLVRTSWIAQIISEQNPDGHWGEIEGGKDHATVLALWALLAYERETTPVPMIQRPS